MRICFDKKGSFGSCAFNVMYLKRLWFLSAYFISEHPQGFLSPGKRGNRRGLKASSPA